MHRFVPLDPARDEPAGESNPLLAAALKPWVIEFLHLPSDTVVHVSTASCVDPGCPIVETRITVFRDDRPPALWRLHHPLHAVSKPLLFSVLATPPSVPPTDDSSKT